MKGCSSAGWSDVRRWAWVVGLLVCLVETSWAGGRLSEYGRSEDARPLDLFVALQPEEESDLPVLPPTVVEEDEPTLPPTVVEEDEPEPEPPPEPPAAPPPPTPVEEGSLTTPSLDEALQDIRLQPGGAGIVPAEEYLRGRVSNLEDALRLTPGVFVTSQNGGDDVFLSIRGSGLSNRAFGRGVNGFIDGIIPTGRIDSGITNQIIPLLATEYIEVYRGGNALDLGATALGGIINFVPYTGYTAEKLRIRSEFGPDNYYRNWVASGDVIGNMDYFFSFDTFNYAGFRQQSQVNNYRLHFNVGYSEENFESRTYFFGDRALQELPGVIPKSVALDTFRRAGTFNSFIDTDRNWLAGRIANKTTWITDYGNQFTVAAYGSYEELDHLPTPFVGIIDNDYRELGVTVRYDIHGELMDRPNQISIGSRFAYQDSEFNRFRYLGTGEEKDLSQQSFDATFRARQFEVFIQDTLEVTDRLRLINGIQFFHTDRIFNDRAFTALIPPGPIPPFPPQPPVTVGDQSFQENFDEVNPRFGFTYDLTDDLLLFGNVSRSAEAPSGSEISDRVDFLDAFPNLAPLAAQTAWTPEIGIRGALTDYLYFDLTYYHSFIDDELLFRQGPVPNTTIVENFDSTIHEGIELGVELDVARGILTQASSRPEDSDLLHLSLVYNWSDFRFDNDPVFGNSRLPGIPEHNLFAILRYEHPNGISIAPNLRYLSSYPLTFDNSGGDAFEIDDYALVGMQLGYQATEDLFCFVDIRNLTDARFLADGNITSTADGAEALVTPGDDIAVYFGFDFRR